MNGEAKPVKKEARGTPNSDTSSHNGSAPATNGSVHKPTVKEVSSLIKQGSGLSIDCAWLRFFHDYIIKLPTPVACLIGGT